MQNTALIMQSEGVYHEKAENAMKKWMGDRNFTTGRIAFFGSQVDLIFDIGPI